MAAWLRTLAHVPAGKRDLREEGGALLNRAPLADAALLSWITWGSEGDCNASSLEEGVWSNWISAGCGRAELLKERQK